MFIYFVIILYYFDIYFVILLLFILVFCQSIQVFVLPAERTLVFLYSMIHYIWMEAITIKLHIFFTLIDKILWKSYLKYILAERRLGSTNASTNGLSFWVEHFCDSANDADRSWHDLGFERGGGLCLTIEELLLTLQYRQSSVQRWWRLAIYVFAVVSKSLIIRHNIIFLYSTIT